MRHTLLRTLIFGLTGGPGLALAVSASAQISFFSIPLDSPTPQVDAEFGAAVAGVGDVDGDTVPDLLVGVGQQDVGGNIDQGQAFVFSGADGSLLFTLDNPTPQATPWDAGSFGWAVAGAGDVDVDSVPDLLIGAPGQSVGGIDSQGQAFVFSGADGSLLFTLDNPTPQTRASFGAVVAGAGDVDGDSVPDLLVGAPSQDVGGNIDQGQAFVFSGADGSLLFTLDNPTPQATPWDEARFGDAVAGAGDVNGDTVPDLLVGATGQNVGGNINQGQAFVLSGADGNLLFTLDDPTPQEFALFGVAVAGAGDVDGDTVPDLLIGAEGQDVGGNDLQGQAFVFSGADGSLLLTLDNPTPQVLALFGRAVAGAGDVDGDTVPDLLVSAPGQDVGGIDRQGQAFVFSGADGSLLFTLDDPTPQQDALFGTAVAGAGDVNGDTVPDLLVGAPGDVGGNERQGQAFLFVSVRELVDADFVIRPGSDVAPINLKSNGVIPAVAFTTDALDATTIDVSTVEFGPALASEAHDSLHLEDVDGDGLLDAVMHFKVQESGIMPGDTEACISGTTTDGASLFGCDEIVTKS